MASQSRKHRGTPAERLARRLVRAPNGCLEWQGHRGTKGHGMIGRGSRAEGHVYTHRLAWEIAHGPIPAGMCVCHKCDNPPCCDPDHLFLGTVADNNADMRAKGRAASLGGYNRRLTDTQVAEIRALVASGQTGSQIGAVYGVTRQYVSQLARGVRR